MHCFADASSRTVKYPGLQYNRHARFWNLPAMGQASSVPLHKRAHDLFVSYSHADSAKVDPVVDWLLHGVGLKVWHDALSGSAAERTSDLLGAGLGSVRGALFLLSSNWLRSTWCKEEHEVALTERRTDNDFSVVAAEIEDIARPPWFRIASVLDFRQFNSRSAAALLRALDSNPPMRLDNDQDLYFAGPWSKPSVIAEATVRALSEMGWRLVGDSRDHPDFTEARDRISAMIGTSRAVVAVLPFDKSRPPELTSPWILEEVEIARTMGRPYLLLIEPGVKVPAELTESAFRNDFVTLSDGGPDADTLADFSSHVGHVPHSNRKAYSFLATSLLSDPREIDVLVSVIERASNMRCVLGRQLPGQHAQQAIIDQIRNAAFVIADVSDDNRNSLIEAGAARGASTPLYLLCRLQADGRRDTRFMFRDMEINWYRDSVEQLGAAYRIARRYRRKIWVPKQY